jgi:hypothetical protein
MEHKYVVGNITTLLHYNSFGKLIKHIDYSHPFYNLLKVYNAKGNLIEIHKYYEKGQKKIEGIDTIYIEYTNYGHLKEYKITDFLNKVVTTVSINDEKIDSTVETEKDRIIYSIKDRILQSKSILEYGKGIADIAYYDDGKIKSQHIQSISGKSWEKELFRRNGTIYGFVKVDNLQLVAGYMIFPQRDTLWSATQNDNTYKLYDENGFLWQKQNLTYDNYLMNERYTYYINGKIAKYEKIDDEKGNYSPAELEIRYPNGTVSPLISKDTSGKYNIFTKYKSDGTIMQNISLINPNYYFNETFNQNGILYNRSAYDKEHGAYGDVKIYNTKGKLQKIYNYNKINVVRYRYFIHDSLVIDKYLAKGLDSIVIVDSSMNFLEKKYYMDGVEYGVGLQTYYGDKIYTQQYNNSKYENVDSIVEINKLLNRKITKINYSNSSRFTRLTTLDSK